MKPLLINLFLVIITFSVYGNTLATKNADGYFRNTTWGMTKKQVKNTENIKLTNNGDDLIGYATISGYPMGFGYYFINDELYQGLYFTELKREPTSKYISAYNHFKELLCTKYGAPKLTDDVYISDNKGFYKRHPENLGKGLIIGEVSYDNEWETSNTKIMLSMWSTKDGKFSRKIKLWILYETKNINLLNKIKKQSDSENLKDV